MFSLICTWINGGVSNREAGDLRGHHAHYDVAVMEHRHITIHSRICSTKIYQSNSTKPYRFNQGLYIVKTGIQLGDTQHKSTEHLIFHLEILARDAASNIQNAAQINQRFDNRALWPDGRSPNLLVAIITFNTLGPKPNGHYFADGILKFTFKYETSFNLLPS